MRKLIAALSLFAFTNLANSQEISPANIVDNKIAEEAPVKTEETKTSNVKHIVKHKLHKGEEGICSKGDQVCIAQKAKNNSSETKDSVSNQTPENK